MNTLENPPLIEAIFELRWGEVAQGEFSFSQDEQSLFAGKVSSAASTKGFSVTEYTQPPNTPPLPMLVTHRFRKAVDAWPCYQIGLGIFTINQVADGYDWETFKQSIRDGLHVLNNADTKHLNAVQDSLHVILRYQDAFYPEPEISVEKYIEEHFNINAGLPSSFKNHQDINGNASSIHFQVNTSTNTPKGQIGIKISNAILNGVPGLLMETVVSSQVSELMTDEISIDNLISWAEDAHKLQKHSFDTLISKSAYS